MSNIIKSILCTIFVLMPSVGLAQNQLPIQEGSFVRSQADCALLYKGELDFIEFSVGKQGYEYVLPEVSCIVAEVKNIRKNRYHVKADCNEFEDVTENQFFLDLLPNKNIRIDGDELLLCPLAGEEAEVGASMPIIPIPALKPDIAPIGSPKTNNVGIKKLIKQWEIEENNCRGGYGDDPETLKACGRRSDVIQALEKAGWCLGKDDESRADMRWHECQKNSIRSF